MTEIKPWAVVYVSGDHSSDIEILYDPRFFKTENEARLVAEEYNKCKEESIGYSPGYYQAMRTAKVHDRYDQLLTKFGQHFKECRVALGTHHAEED